MEGIVELARALGRLEQRMDELEALVRNPAKEDPGTAGPCIATMVPVEEETDEMTPDKLLQQGIDNIMSHQWPPVGRANNG